MANVVPFIKLFKTESVQFSSFKMIIFETLEKHFCILGISRAQYPVFLKALPFDTIHKIMISILYIFCIFPLFLLISFEIKSFEEFAETSAIFADITLLAVCYWIFLREKAKLTDLISGLKKIVQKSEYSNHLEAKMIPIFLHRN